MILSGLSKNIRSKQYNDLTLPIALIVIYSGVTFSAGVLRETEKMELLSRKPRVVYLVSALFFTACVCTSSVTPFDHTPNSGTRTAPAVYTEARTQTHTVRSAPSGESYLAATFPSVGKIFLFSPQPDEVVANPWADVFGTAPAETVITLNDEIAVAGPDGYFSARVPLEEGPNEIQCVASDLEGNEVFFSMVIVYVLEG